MLQKLCDQAYAQAYKDLESFACLVLDIDEGRCSGAWFKPADGRSCVAVAQAIEAGECGRRNKAAHANDWYAKACALGAQSACGKQVAYSNGELFAASLNFFNKTRSSS